MCLTLPWMHPYPYLFRVRFWIFYDSSFLDKHLVPFSNIPSAKWRGHRCFHFEASTIKFWPLNKIWKTLLVLTEIKIWNHASGPQKMKTSSPGSLTNSNQRLCNFNKLRSMDSIIAYWFWRSASFTLTLATLQEYDLVVKKCLEENINLRWDSES